MNCKYQISNPEWPHKGQIGFITDINGDTTQHLQYLPFGEDFVHQQNTAAYYTPYTFSGKERDVETSLSYFGARYYEASLSIWLSVDPLSDKYPSLSAYNYCALNPVMLVDPDGRELLGHVEIKWAPPMNTIYFISTSFSKGAFQPNDLYLVTKFSLMG